MHQIVVPLEYRDLHRRHALEDLPILLIGRDPVDATELAIGSVELLVGEAEDFHRGKVYLYRMPA